MGKTSKRLVWLLLVVGLCGSAATRCWRVYFRKGTPSLVVLVHAAIDLYEEEMGRSPSNLAEISPKLRELSRGSKVRISSIGEHTYVIEQWSVRGYRRITFCRRMEVIGERYEYYWTGN